jgi:DegV family protein with EDD domain
MPEIAVVTDSTAYLPEKLIREYSIQVLPLKVIWGSESLNDNVDITPAAFYQRLKTSKAMPTTSQVTVGEFKTLFERLHAQGKEILCILISREMSGTVASAEAAMAEIPEARVALVDSRTTTVDLAYQVLVGARAARDGAAVQACVRAVEQDRQNSGVVFAVDTLEFLHRGGRIGGAKRFLGTMLNIKPILTLTDGRVDALEQARTRKKSLVRLVEIVNERVAGKPNLRIGVAHADAPAEAESLLQAAANSLNPVETMIAELSPVIGTHVGPGTLALTYHFGE